MTNKNPMSAPEPWTMVAEGYVTDTKPLFEQYCRKAMEQVGFDGNGKVLDVACGPGTLSLLIHGDAKEIHAIDFSPGMLECFNRELTRQGIENVTTWHMDGQNLEFGDNEFDWAFSIFGLMFFPDRIKGFREIRRTLKPGGGAAVTSWAPLSDSPGMQLMFGAIQEAFPKKPESDGQKVLNLEDPKNFRREMEEAGFVDIEITHFDGSWPVESVESFLDSMIRGSAPLVMLKNAVGEEVWAGKRAVMLEFLADRFTDLPTTLHSRAFIGTGRKHS